MILESILMTAGVSALVGAAVYFPLNKKLASLQAMSAENDKRVKDSAKKEQQAKAQTKQINILLNEKNKKINKLEKELETSKKTFELALEDSQKELQDKVSLGKSIERDLEHHKSQSEALMKQIHEIDQEKRDLRINLESKNKELEKNSSSEIKNQKSLLQKLKKKNHETEYRLKSKKTECALLEKKLSAVDENAIKKAKGKTAQYHQLYKLISGQKELLEERNNNWELALKLLSTWIITENAPTYKQPDNLGALVATALELTKQGSLVQDDFSLPQQEGEKETLAAEKTESSAQSSEVIH